MEARNDDNEPNPSERDRLIEILTRLQDLEDTSSDPRPQQLENSSWNGREDNRFGKVAMAFSAFFRIGADICTCANCCGGVSTFLGPASTALGLAGFFATADSVGVRFDVVDNKIERLCTEVAEVKSEVAAVKSEVAAVKSEVAAVKSEVAEVKSEVNNKIELLHTDFNRKLDSQMTALKELHKLLGDSVRQEEEAMPQALEETITTKPAAASPNKRETGGKGKA